MSVSRRHPELAIVLFLSCLSLTAQQATSPRDISFFELTRKATAGDAVAQEQLGTCYSLGFCVGVGEDAKIEPDDSKAAQWYKKAAAQGNTQAESDLATTYRFGLGVPRDLTLAFQWVQKAAEAGLLDAQLNLGLAYENGLGVSKDTGQARLWLQRAADRGNLNAKAQVEKLDAFARLDESAKKLQAFIDAQSAPDSSAPVVTPTAPVTPPEAAPAPASTTPARGFAPELPADTQDSAGAVAIPHNYALIFATDDYTNWPHLTNPISDGNAVGLTLRSLYNFQVEEVPNATVNQIIAKLTEYLHRNFQPQDQLLIFFSGHGSFDNDIKRGFIVPADALRPQDDIGHRSLLALDTIQDYANHIPSQHTILVIDSCFSGTLDRRIADSGLRGDPSSDIYVHASLPELLARKEAKRTRRYFTSGSKEFVPDGLPGHHSPFTSAFLVTLNEGADRKGYLTLNDIQQGFDTVKPEPRWGDIQDSNDPGADILLLTPDAVAQLSKPN